MSNKQNDIIREDLEDIKNHYYCEHEVGKCFAEVKLESKPVPYKYHNYGVVKWWKFIPKNLKINKEVTFEEVKDDAN